MTGWGSEVRGQRSEVRGQAQQRVRGVRRQPLPRAAAPSLAPPFISRAVDRERERGGERGLHASNAVRGWAGAWGVGGGTRPTPPATHPASLRLSAAPVSVCARGGEGGNEYKQNV